MKRLMRVFCCLLVLLLLPVTAQADVIYMPFDSFYDQHMADCTYVSRNYTAKGPNGEVTLYVSPEDAQVEAIYPNDTELYVSYTYEDADGVIWACCDKWGEDVTGWVPMEYLELIYDGKSFAEEYGDQFEAVERSMDISDLGGEAIYFWEYPGCKEPFQGPSGVENGPTIINIYRDELGYEWGQCGYYYGIKGHWINLTDPTADYETLYPNVPEETVSPETVPAATEQVEEIKPSENSEKRVVTLAVAAVVAITAVMLVVLKKKK